MQEIFKYNDIDFEVNLQDFFTCMYYKGEPFTGTLVEENSTTEFKNRNAHGKCVEYHDNGQLIYESFFEDGEYVSSKTWYPSGQIRSEWSSGKDSFDYDIDGKVIHKNSDFFYKNGNLRKYNNRNKTEYYNSRGELTVIIEPNSQEYQKSIFHVNKEKLFECYSELYFELYPYISTYKDNLGGNIKGWFWYLLSQNEDDKIFAINAMIQLLNDERNRDKYDLEWILKQMDKVDLTNEWKKYYSEIIDLK